MGERRDAAKRVQCDPAHADAVGPRHDGVPQLVQKHKAEDETEKDDRHQDACQPATLAEHQPGHHEKEQQRRVDPNRDSQDAKDFK